MLNFAISDTDCLYWEIEAPNPNPPKLKKIKVDEELVTNSLSTVKTAISLIRTRQTSTHQGRLAHIESRMAMAPPTKNISASETQMVASQTSTITQLTKQVSILQLAQNEINSKLDKLAEFIMAQSASNKTPPLNAKLLVASEEALAKPCDDPVQLAMCKVLSCPA